MYDTAQGQNSLMQAQYANHATQGAICADSDRKATASEEIINRLGNINGILRDVIASQRNLIDRLHGASPVNPSSEKSPPSPNGHLAAIDERLQWVMQAAQEISSNQNKLAQQLFDSEDISKIPDWIIGKAQEIYPLAFFDSEKAVKPLRDSVTNKGEVI